MNIMKKHCREYLYSVISVFSETIPPFLGIFTLLNLLPAFFYGCSAPEQLHIPPESSDITVDLTRSPGNIEDLDIFVFRDDRLQKIDCYQKVPDPDLWNRKVISSYGERFIAVCANSRKGIMEWTEISSFPSLQRLGMSLEDDSIDYPFMSGMKNINSGQEGQSIDMELSPLSSIVRLHSICCDFSGRPYAGEKLTDVKVYLTNVNAECRFFDEKDILPSRIINAGCLREEDMEALPVPSILYRELSEDIGQQVIHPGIDLLCYPNNAVTESPGTPFTRLVIEGKVCGQTYYWPIDINRENAGKGVVRNESYIYDIRITRKGSLDPDIPARAEDIEILYKIEKWEERENYKVIF